MGKERKEKEMDTEENGVMGKKENEGSLGKRVQERIEGVL
jgi:hypothetical protein